MYGTTIKRALGTSNISVAEAAAAMGYKRADMLYRVLRNEADPSLDALQRLADRLNVPVGDLLPNSGAGPVTDELRDVLAAISGLAGDAREEVISALAVNARVLANAYRRPARPQSEISVASEPRRDEKRKTDRSIAPIV